MNTTNASWNTASFAPSYCQLAAGAVLGWQKANPDVPVYELPDRDAFRKITGLDREAKPSQASFQALQNFFRSLKINEDEELPASFQGALDMVLPPGRLNPEAKDVCAQMLQGANDLFKTNYPKVKDRHQLLSFRQDDDEGRLMAADYFQHNPLFPEDLSRGILIQLVNPQPHDDHQAAEKRKNEIIGELAEALEEEFPFVTVGRLPVNFKNGAGNKVYIALTEQVSARDLESFFSSEHGRFVKEVGGRLREAGRHKTAYLKTFLDLPLVRSLKSLTFWYTDLRAADAAVIADSPFLSNLTSLDMESNPIGDAGAEAIFRSPFLSHLTSLDLRSTGIGYEMMALIQERWSMAKV